MNAIASSCSRRLVLMLALFLPFRLVAGTKHVDRYNFVWPSPSKDAIGVMPIGNGDIAAGVYAIENGDLYLLLAKNDAFTYAGDIFKTGRVRVSLEPNPFKSGSSGAAGKILLLPAWPADWDVDFKLHLTCGAVLSGTVKDGRLTAWEIQPSSRRSDVIVGQPQPAKSPTSP